MTAQWDEDIRAVFPEWQTRAALDRWPAIKQTLAVGQTVSGEVISRAPFGVWLDIQVGQPALLLVVNMDRADSERITFEDYPQKGSYVTARINALGEKGEIGVTQQDPDRTISLTPTRSVS